MVHFISSLFMAPLSLRESVLIGQYEEVCQWAKQSSEQWMQYKSRGYHCVCCEHADSKRAAGKSCDRLDRTVEIAEVIKIGVYLFVRHRLHTHAYRRKKEVKFYVGEKLRRGDNQSRT